MADKVAPYGLSGLVTGQTAPAQDLDKVKRNIQRMMNQGAPETDIDAYLSGEGVTPQQLQTHSQAPQREALLKRRDELDDQEQLSTLGGTAKSIGGALDDNVRLAANGMSMGFLDKALGSGDRAKTNAARDRQGLTGGISEMAGSFAPAIGAGAAGLTTAKIPGLIGKYLSPTLDGAAFGAATALGNEQDIATGAGYGAGFGLLGQAAGGLVNKGFAAFKKPNVPSTESLIAQKNAAYGIVDNSGAQYSPEQLAALRQGIGDDMAAGKMHPSINPKVSAVNDIIGEDLGRGPMTLSDLDRTRQVVNRKVFDNAPTTDDARLGGSMLQNFDEFVDATPPAIGGDNSAIVDALKQARTLNKRVAKTQTIEEALDKAGRQAAVTGSGGNADNATRQKINALLNSKRASRQFSPEERAMMEKLARGSASGNAMRLAGKLSPQGNGLMAALGVGGAMTNPILGIPALVGIAAKTGGDRATRKLAEELLASVKTGGNYKAPSMSPASKGKMQALIRALVSGSTTAAVTQGN